MIEYLVIAGLGWWWGASGRPRTKVEARKLYGPKSGKTWNAEVFPELGVVVVRGAGAAVVFKKTPEGMQAKKSSGNQAEVEIIIKDFHVQD